MNAVGTSGPVVWVPGMPDTQNLGGTVRTLDGVSGATTLSPGLVSRAGWVVYDDSESPVLDTGSLFLHALYPSMLECSLSFPVTVGSTGIVDNVLESELWPVSRAGCGAKDWYFFGHGVAHRITLPTPLLSINIHMCACRS